MAVKDRCSTAQKRNSDQIRTRAEVRAMGQWGLKRAERRADVGGAYEHRPQMSQGFLANTVVLSTKLKDNAIFRVVLCFGKQNILGGKKTQLIYENEEWVQQTGLGKDGAFRPLPEQFSRIPRPCWHLWNVEPSPGSLCVFDS